jgi:hypothetical protein
VEWGINGWRAPADVTYFVTTSRTIYRESGGALYPNPNPQASYPGVLAVRRLLADDTPAGHAFVESAPLPMKGVSDMAVRKLARETKPALLMIGAKLPATNGGPVQVASLEVVAFAAPVAAPEDAAPPAFGGPSLPLAQVTAMPSLTPHPWEIDNRGPRLFDADGDGVRDQVLTRTTYSYSGFGLAYGMASPAGTFRLPWDVPSMTNFGSQIILEHLDYDGDGCEDVLVAGHGLRLFRGLRCVHH